MSKREVLATAGILAVGARLLIPLYPYTFGDGTRMSLAAARSICASFLGGMAQAADSGAGTTCGRISLAWDTLSFVGYGGAVALALSLWLFIRAKS